MTTCANCGKPLPDCDAPAAEMSWCGEDCLTAWSLANPEASEGWVLVDDLDLEQRAELDGLLGHGEPC